MRGMFTITATRRVLDRIHQSFEMCIISLTFDARCAMVSPFVVNDQLRFQATMAAAYASTLSTLFSSASALVGRTAISSNYTLASSSTSSNSSSSPTSTSIIIGVWTVERATHNTSGKVVSVWSCDKSRLTSSSDRAGASGTAKRLERTLAVLRKEATSLSRLRHPSILEVVEPVEENRSVLGCLRSESGHDVLCIDADFR